MSHDCLQQIRCRKHINQVILVLFIEQNLRPLSIHYNFFTQSHFKSKCEFTK